jgi:hypothetical protein
LTTKLSLFVVALLSLAACVTAPVQEMSDARQALRSAEAVGAARASSGAFATAQRLLREAQMNLEAGAYENARRLALDARDEAIRAREQAARETAIRVTSPAPP